jgi:hypothetical protein
MKSAESYIYKGNALTINNLRGETYSGLVYHIGDKKP